jgi:hypothetical protein
MSGLDSSLSSLTMKRSVAIVVAIAGVLSGALLLFGGVWSTTASERLGHHETSDAEMPLDVLSVFGDREKRYDALGPNYVYLDESFVDSDNNCDFCYGIKYDGGPNEKAFVGFRSSEPVDLSRASFLLFDARGEQGGEVISVYALGQRVESNLTEIEGLEFAFSRDITLNREWKGYQVDISEFERATVTHGLAFVVRQNLENASEIAYFDNIYYDSEKQDYAINLN